MKRGVGCINLVQILRNSRLGQNWLEFTGMNPAHLSDMENLTPELERRLQVEEAWARRTVFEDFMNASRHQRFLERKNLFYRCQASDVGSNAVPKSLHSLAPVSKPGLFSSRTADKLVISAIALACSLFALSASGVMQHILSL